MRFYTIIVVISALTAALIFGCQKQSTGNFPLGDNLHDEVERENWLARLETEDFQRKSDLSLPGRYPWCDALDRSYAQTAREQSLTCCKAPQASWIMHSDRSNQSCTDLELAYGDVASIGKK